MKSLTHAELSGIMASALDIENESLPAMEFNLSELEIDWETVPTPLTIDRHSALPPTSGTQKISIRIPARTLAAFKARAADTGCRYQTMMLDALQSTFTSWGST